MSTPRVWTGDLRREYGKGRLCREDLNADPILQFGEWFEAGKPTVLEPNAMALATADASGRPSIRMVLLKSFDEGGFVFGTSYLSRKSRELKENPAAALLFYWAALERQVRICGQIEITSAAESDEIFLHRSPGSRIASRAVRQSEPVESRQVLEELVASEAERYAGKEVDRPDFWGGFNLVPNEIEFWQGGRDRLHDRFLYTKADHEWGLVRLQP